MGQCREGGDRECVSVAAGRALALRAYTGRKRERAGSTEAGSLLQRLIGVETNPVSDGD